MLVSVGDLATDVVVRVGAAEIDPVSDTPAAVSLHRGGAGANVAAVAARLGRPTRFVGALGRDELAVGAAARLTELGVDVAGPAAERGWSVVVLVDPDGGRRFLTDVGDVGDWGAPDDAWLNGADRLHLSGYALGDERSSETCRQLGASARSLGVPVSVDPCSVSVIRRFGVDRFASLVAELAPDVVLPNEDEAGLLGEAASGAWVVVTRGAGPTEVRSPGGDRRSFPVEPVRVVDTTGAGDAFTAGFLVAWDERNDIAGAVAAGHSAASRVVTAPGADAWQAAPR